MATIIDALITKFIIDPSGVKEGSKQAQDELDKLKKKTKKDASDIEQHGKQAAEFFNQVRRAAVQFFAVLTAGRGLADFTRTVVNTGAQLSRLSLNLGLSVETMSKWGQAVELQGGTTQEFIGTIQGLSAQLTELQLTGNSAILPYLSALGISVSDATGRARPLTDIIKDIGDKLAKLPSRQNAYNIAKSMGLDEGTFNLIIRGGREVDSLVARQKGMSTAQAEAAKHAQEQWIKTEQRIKAVSQELVIKLLPSLEKLANSLARFAEIAAPALSMVLDMFVKLDDATGGWSTSLIAATMALRLLGGGAILSGLGALAGKLMSVGSAAGLAKAGLVGAAGAAGYAAGTYLYDKKIAGTPLADKIGKGVAGILSYLGVEEARQAIDINEFGMSATTQASKSIPPPSAPVVSASAGKYNWNEIRAIRNNNPGNLEFRKQRSAVPEPGSGRFAMFPDMQTGIGALARQLQLYAKRGIDTLDKIIPIFAPPNENKTKKYIEAMSQSMGVGTGQSLNMRDPAVLEAMIRGISRVEAGKDYLQQADIRGGIQKAAGNNSISINQVTINTQATDTKGIVRDFRTELVRQSDGGIH